jgi:nicotinamide-nucleotide amidase
MTSIILSVGDELILGQTVDTNSAWISRELASVGCDIAAHATVPDDQPAIEAAIRAAAGRCDVLIISGGIGPTADDLTRQSLAAVLGVELVTDASWLEKLHEFWAKRGGTMPAMNAIQAEIPAGATIIPNTAGTAAGIDAVWQSGDLKLTCRIFVVPGVPKEMKAMIAGAVMPFLRANSGGAVILSRTLHTFGMGESAVAEKLGDLMKRDRNPSVGTTVANGFVSLRVNCRATSLALGETEIATMVAACRAAVGDLIFGEGEQTLVGQIVELLKRDGEKSMTVATAESCTGGLLAKMLTDLPGSSDWFTHGWVTYSNKAKHERLGVSSELIDIYGAVSQPTVDAMAKAARRLSKSTFALAISGIAGPGGGSATKPVGTVVIGLAYQDPADRVGSVTTVRTFNFSGDRDMIRDRAAKMALTMLRFHLLGKAMPF